MRENKANSNKKNKTQLHWTLIEIAKALILTYKGSDWKERIIYYLTFSEQFGNLGTK